MELYERLGIKSDLLLQIKLIVSSCKNVEKACIFGSRARGDYKYNSDIDIAVFGRNITSDDFNYIENELNQINTAFEFDIINFEKIAKLELKESIKQDGVEIYDNKKG